MNVIIVCDFGVASGGAPAVAIESALALAEAGVSVTFIHAITDHDPRLKRPGITCIDMGIPDVWDRGRVSGAIAGIWNRDYRTRLSAILAKAPAGETIIHIHQWTRAFSPSVFRVALASKHPVVVTAHDYFLSCPNGVYYRFDQQRPCALKPLSVGCLSAGCDPISPAHKAIRVLRSAATMGTLAKQQVDVIHVSDRGRDTLAPMLSNRVRHHRIDNPVALSKAAAPTAANRGRRFAYIGRLTREKGAVVAAQASRIADVPMIFIGEGPGEADIRAANPKAEILGWLSRDEVGKRLHHEIAAVVAPSLWFETGPLTIYEAAAAGIAAIASNRCGASERVDHGSTGFVVEPSPDDVAAAMRNLADPATAERFGDAAYAKFWRDPPTPEAHAARLLALYRSILDERLDTKKEPLARGELLTL